MTILDGLRVEWIQILLVTLPNNAAIAYFSVEKTDDHPEKATTLPCGAVSFWHRIWDTVAKFTQISGKSNGNVRNFCGITATTIPVICPASRRTFNWYRCIVIAKYLQKVSSREFRYFPRFFFSSPLMDVQRGVRDVDGRRGASCGGCGMPCKCGSRSPAARLLRAKPMSTRGIPSEIKGFEIRALSDRSNAHRQYISQTQYWYLS